MIVDNWLRHGGTRYLPPDGQNGGGVGEAGGKEPKAEEADDALKFVSGPSGRETDSRLRRTASRFLHRGLGRARNMPAKAFKEYLQALFPGYYRRYHA